MCIIPFNSSQTGLGEPGLRVIFKVSRWSSKMHLSSPTSKLLGQFATNFQCGAIPRCAGGWGGRSRGRCGLWLSVWRAPLSHADWTLGAPVLWPLLAPDPTDPPAERFSLVLNLC